AFERKHGNLLRILEVEVQPATLEALVQYYDPPARCFTFRDFQMTPTLEEYERLLGFPLTESTHYFHQEQPSSWATVAKGEAIPATRKRRLASSHGRSRTTNLWDFPIPAGRKSCGPSSYGSIPGQKNIGEKTPPWLSWQTPTTPSTIFARRRREVSNVAPPCYTYEQNYMPSRGIQVELDQNHVKGALGQATK
ncbi:hypothetical protein CR513_43643, partial [Mucuna pruriens]